MTSIFHSKRLDPPSRAKLLGDVLQRARRHAEAGTCPVIVFDLDGTLIDNRPRVVAILHELGDFWRDKHPEAAARCRAATVGDIGYGVVDNLRRLGVEHSWLHDEGLSFWKQRFFTDEYQEHDVEVPGAVKFARACHETGALLVYLTGRDLPGMAIGTFKSLRDLGFPIGTMGVKLVTKPAFEIPDTQFKRDVAGELGRFGEVLAVFDNEPANCNLLLDAYPECTSVFVDTQHAPDPPNLYPSVHVIDTFEM
ncbi:MAG: HAD family hydrolase [Polyangiaceae bacterium]|nr:HAD family hydrolase [Polyangiaceae bacterium]